MVIQMIRKKTKKEWFKEFKILIKGVKGYKNKEDALEFLDNQIKIIEEEAYRTKLRQTQIKEAKDDLPMRIVLASIDQNWRTVEEIYEIVKQDFRFEEHSMTRTVIINRLNKLVKNKLVCKEQFRENDSPNAKVKMYYKERK